MPILFLSYPHCVICSIKATLQTAFFRCVFTTICLDNARTTRLLNEDLDTTLGFDLF